MNKLNFLRPNIENLNTEMFSGFMITLVGLIYFGYNFFGEVH